MCVRPGIYAVHVICGSLLGSFAVAAGLGVHVARHRDGVRGAQPAVARVGAHAQERAAGRGCCAAGAAALARFSKASGLSSIADGLVTALDKIDKSAAR